MRLRSDVETVLIVGTIALLSFFVIESIFTYRNEEHFLFKAKLVDIKNGSTPYLVFDNGKLIAWSSLSTVQIGKTYNVYEIERNFLFLPLSGNRIEEVGGGGT